MCVERLEIGDVVTDSWGALYGGVRVSTIIEPGEPQRYQGRMANRLYMQVFPSY